MEISEFLEEFNNSTIGKNLRLFKFKISQESIDKINTKYGTTLTLDSLDFMSMQPILYEEKLPPEIFEEIKSANEFKFENTNDVKKMLSTYNIDGKNLIEVEDVQVLKHALEITELDELSIRMIVPEIADLSELPLSKLSISFGKVLPETFEKLPDVSGLLIKNVEFDSISDLARFSNLTELEINIHPDDPQLEMSDIDKLENLTSLKINGQTLTQEDFEKICTLSKLKQLDLGFGKTNSDFSSQGHKIEVISSIVNLSNLEKFDANSKLTGYFYKPVVSSVEELRKLLKNKAFLGEGDKKPKLIYIGTEVLPSDLLDEIDDIELTIESPFVISKEFATKYETGFPGMIKIEDENYEGYTTPELYAIRQKMQEIINGIPKDASDFEKAAHVYKVIGENCFYDHTGCIDDEEYIEGREKITRSLKGGLLENKLVCRGYALVMKKILDELDVDCKIVSGQALGVDGEEVGAHAWNQVKIDDIWYNMDLTWDARNIRSQDELEFLLISDEEFYKSHKAYNQDTDVRDYIEDGKFNFVKYKEEENKEKDIRECSQSYDKDEITEFFGSHKKELQKSDKIAVTISHDETVTINQIESEMSLMAAVEREQGLAVEDKDVEGRDD